MLDRQTAAIQECRERSLPYTAGLAPESSHKGRFLPTDSAEDPKIRDHDREAAVFITLLEERLTALGTQPKIRAEFIKEMRRFLPASLVRDTLERDSYWAYLTRVVTESGRKAVAAL